MKNYFRIIAISFSIGLLDWVVKGIVPFNDLPDFLQSWSWHITIFLFHTLWIVLFAWVTEWRNLIGIASIINEDMAYYVYKSIILGQLYWNDWFFESILLYLLAIVFVNLLLLVLLLDFDIWDRFKKFA